MKIKFVNEIYKQGFKEKESRIECIKLILLTDGDEGKILRNERLPTGAHKTHF